MPQGQRWIWEATWVPPDGLDWPRHIYGSENSRPAFKNRNRIRTVCDSHHELDFCGKIPAMGSSNAADMPRPDCPRLRFAPGGLQKVHGLQTRRRHGGKGMATTGK